MPEGYNEHPRGAIAAQGSSPATLVTRSDTAYAHIDRVNVDTPIVGRIVRDNATRPASIC